MPRLDVISMHTLPERGVRGVMGMLGPAAEEAGGRDAEAARVQAGPGGGEPAGGGEDAAGVRSAARQPARQPAPVQPQHSGVTPTASACLQHLAFCCGSSFLHLCPTSQHGRSTSAVLPHEYHC